MDRCLASASWARLSRPASSRAKRLTTRIASSVRTLDNEILVAETKLKKAKARRGGCCGTSERTIEKLEARLAKLRLIKEDRNTFDVVVPPGGGAGDLLQVTDPMEF